MRHLTLLLLLSLLIASPALADKKVPAPSGETIVSPDAKLEHLFTRSAKINGGLTEGPAVAPDGSIYFSDIPVGKDKGMILRYDPQSKKVTTFTDDSGKSNGLIFNSKGNLLACEGSDHGGRRISSWNVKTGKRTTVVDKIDGKRFNACNDIALDRKGRIYFTDPRYLGDEPRELEYRAVYVVDTDGTVHEATHDISKPNGIVISPDGKTLYVADHDNGTDKIDPNAAPPTQGDMKIYAYQLDKNGRVKGKRKTLVDFGAGKGCDGMTVDEHGNIYLTVRNSQRPGVMVVNPKGKEIAFIPTGPAKQGKLGLDNPPVGLPSNVEFGIGDEVNVLYITVDVSLYRIPLKVKGYLVQYAGKK